ncbi:uncharacterized protein LOC5501758 isoform X2 [Nematostella vectensis]|uniref:uncharacterized protein LOC5501758 isoform X2 n=1 Tax=Nematostella vectensis TaxID=45351 RepID=UPI00207742D3|nr:uncharacterized protein LOC5501758 isoform X2 [Nematostella vectensis]
MDEVSKLCEALPPSDVPTFHVEVCQQPCSTALPNTLKDYVKQFLICIGTAYGDTTFNHFENEFLNEHIKSISICDTDLVLVERKAIDLQSCKLAIHVFQLHDDGPASEELEDEITAANHWLLPAAEFEGIWDSLVFDTDVKAQLINYATTTLLFSDRGVNANIITWNRVILLHAICRSCRGDLILKEIASDEEVERPITQRLHQPLAFSTPALSQSGLGNPETPDVSLYKTCETPQKPLDKMNEFLHSRDLSPTCLQCATPWEAASDRTKRYYEIKAKEGMAAIIEQLVPNDPGSLWNFVSPSMEKRYGNPRDTDTIDDTLMGNLAKCYNAASGWEVRRQVLSIMADKLSLKQLRSWIPDLSQRCFAEARRHSISMEGVNQSNLSIPEGEPSYQPTK